MNEATLQSQRDWFEAALEQPEPLRHDWLLRYCSDPELRASVSALLAAHEQTQGLLEVPAAAAIESLGEADAPIEPDSLIGIRIGAFRLLSLLGQGGMATVFQGEREGADFSQRVAVKLLRRGLFSALEQRLFRRERQALAALSHPNIARLIDGGVTEAGIPYLVMEYVDGVPLTRYVVDHRLDLRARLTLFCIVCRAVNAAHRTLIVHRDLKPSNILVAADGEVKLLDFGIAKLLDEEDDGVTRTAFGALTPGYAAPEQFTGGQITTATDVYALGVLLHELLLGIRPAPASPRRPSVRAAEEDIDPLLLPASKSAVRAALKGDIDNILLKAFANEPERRYVSAGALAEDIERYLRAQPVSAHPPSRWYRVRKFTSRHTGGVVTTLAFMIAILAALGITLWQADVARREAARANTVRDFLEGIFAPIQNSLINSRQATVRDLLANATERLKKDKELGAAESIDLLLLFSRLQEKMGEPGKAQALAEQASRQASAKLSPNDPLALDAQISLAWVLLDRDNDAQAEPLLKAAEARIGGTRKLNGMPLVRLYDGLAILADNRGQHEVGVRYERAALAERLARFGADDLRVSVGYNNLALSLDLSGRYDEALDAYRRSYETALAAAGPDSFDTAIPLNNLAQAELSAGHLRDARKNFERVAALFSAPPNDKRDRNVEHLQTRCLLEATIDPAGAGEVCARTVHLAEEIFGTNSINYSRALRHTALWKIEQGALADARQDLMQASSLLGPNSSPVLIGRIELAMGEIDLIEGGRPAAVRQLEAGLRHMGQGYPSYARLNGVALLALACDSRNGRPTQCAVDTFEKAKTAIDAHAQRWSPMLLRAHIALARVDLARGNARPAHERLRSANAHAENEMESTHPRLLEARLWLALADADAGDCERAKAGARAAGELVSEYHLHMHPMVATAAAQLQRDEQCGAFGQ